MGAMKHVFRRLAAAPAFAFAALLTLAIGVGANTAIFSVIEGVLIKPLPYPHSDSLVSIWHTAPGISGIGGKLNTCPTMYFTYREQNRTFEQIGIARDGGANITGLAEPERVRALSATYGVLDALGVRPVLGRWFNPADDSPGTPETVILSYGYWRRRFSGDSSVIGRTLTVDMQPRTVIGVMPAGFMFQDIDAELILPLRFERNKLFLGNFSYQGVARLKPGVTLEQANADLGRMLGIWLNAWPLPPGFSRSLFENAHLGPALVPLKQEVVGDIGATLGVIMGTLGLVLLIACANVANLLLVRAEGRQHELAIRAALGAGWGRLAREMLLESITLSLLGGALGLGFAYGAVRLLVARGPSTMPRLGEISIDPLVLAFAVAVSLLSGILFGIIPVLKYATPELQRALRGAGRSLSQSRERHRARNTLVIVQVALALVLLTGSGLMIRTFQALRSVKPGITHPEQLQLLHISLPESAVKEPARVTQMERDMLNKLAAIPGVKSAAFAGSAPFEGFASNNDVLFAEDKVYGVHDVPPVRRFRSVTPGFFKTTGTPLIVGREFDWADIDQKRHVAIVSENLARELWGNPSAALGKRIREGAADPWREIVGVVGDVTDNGVQKAPPSFAYWPIAMDIFYGPNFVNRYGAFILRTDRAGTESLLNEAERAVWSVDGNVPIAQVQTVQTLYDRYMARTSFTLVLLAIAGAMALLLGIVGIYGVIAYAVSKRTREIGIRVALGAQAAGLQGMFVRQALVLAGVGAALGLAAAAGLTRLMSSLLYGVNALDPVTYAAVAAVLLAAAALASYLPARRATRIDPAEALRAE